MQAVVLLVVGHAHLDDVLDLDLALDGRHVAEADDAAFRLVRCHAGAVVDSSGAALAVRVVRANSVHALLIHYN